MDFCLYTKIQNKLKGIILENKRSIMLNIFMIKMSRYNIQYFNYNNEPSSNKLIEIIKFNLVNV